MEHSACSHRISQTHEKIELGLIHKRETGGFHGGVMRSG